MFAKKVESANDGSIKAFLEYGCEFEGKLSFSGIVRVNGRLKGDIISESCLIVGETAVIEGTLHVGSLIIGGRVHGEIVAKERIEIQATGQVSGKVRAPILVSHEGAQLEGDVVIAKTKSA